MRRSSFSIGLIAGAVAFASYGPARRAARVDPASMLAQTASVPKQ
jgi:hypothetical protein